ncbi:MAG: hypothetical protein MUO54_02980, partial [Anaerolineales bacterium]|nr:hypothetical protein [Anaerolineales bacterium]
MKKSTWIIIGIIAVLFLVFGSFSAGAVVGNLLIPQPDLNWFNRAPESVPAHSSEGENSADSAAQSIDELFIPFWETWDIVQDQFIDQPIDDVALMRGAISGMLESLGDEHTSYMDPD